MKIYFSHDLGEPRADVVREHWLARPDHEDAGFFDALQWGEAALAGPPTIRGLLAKALDNTSVTCVLIGPETAGQRWVRYEIVQSIQRKNLLIGVHINGIPDRMQRTTTRGKPIRGACHRRHGRRGLDQGASLQAERLAPVPGHPRLDAGRPAPLTGGERHPLSSF